MRALGWEIRKKEQSLRQMPLQELNEFLAKLDSELILRGGNPQIIIREFMKNQECFDKLANHLLRLGNVSAFNERIARILLGNYIFTLEDWVRNYNVFLRCRSISRTQEFWVDEGFLQSPCPFFSGKMIKDTHAIFLGMAYLQNSRLTIRTWQEIEPKYFEFFGNTGLCQNSEFADQTLELRWYLMLREPMPQSFGKSRIEQEKLLPDGYHVPTVIAQTALGILFQKKEGLLSEGKWFRCLEKDQYGTYAIGRFGSKLTLRPFPDEVEVPDIGMGAMRYI